MQADAEGRLQARACRSERRVCRGRGMTSMRLRAVGGMLLWIAQIGEEFYEHYQVRCHYDLLH